MPEIVYNLWILTLVIAVVLLPFIVRLLHKTFRSAQSIERYLREMKEAALGIAGHTEHVTALNSTTAVATDILDTAGKIDGNAETLKVTMANRANRFK